MPDEGHPPTSQINLAPHEVAAFVDVIRFLRGNPTAVAAMLHKAEEKAGKMECRRRARRVR
jgi:hypothetical protein